MTSPPTRAFMQSIGTRIVRPQVDALKGHQNPVISRHVTLMEPQATEGSLESSPQVKSAALNNRGNEELVVLYRRAFQEFGTRALWNMQPVHEPAPADAMAITRTLRTHAGMEGRRLAERIEELCRAAH